jgi:hypothetical protein
VQLAFPRDALTAQETDCKATVAFSVILDTLEANRQCFDYKRQASYEHAKGKSDSAKSTLTTANQAVATAETKATDATTEVENAVAAAVGRLSACPVCLSYPSLVCCNRSRCLSTLFAHIEIL